MEIPVAVAELTDAELYGLEHLLRKIKEGQKSPSARRLAEALDREVRWRACYTLVDLSEIGRIDDEN
jgi:hypothetical protein